MKVANLLWSGHIVNAQAQCIISRAYVASVIH